MKKFSAQVLMACALLFLSTDLFSIDLVSYRSSAIDKKLWQDPYWHKLLHYQKTMFGQNVSQADAKNFFLSANGKTNPQDELLKNLDALFDTKTYENPNDHPACKFPLRYLWLKEQLSIQTDHEIYCPELIAWKEALGANDMSLVFASSYTNNPASMFGHTFLRLHRTKDEKKLPDLLHYTINFAAETGKEKGMLYTLKGLFGFYPGYFSTFPFYIKIQQYNNVESRDLWEYDLNIPPDELQKMVLHLWELGSTYFAYYFVDENCSYYLLSLLESTNHDVQLIRYLPFFTTPVDTMKIVSNHTNWIVSTSFRPSLRKRFEASYKTFNPQEKKAINEVIRYEETKNLGNLPQELQAKVLDTSMDFLSMKEKQNAKTPFQKKLMEIRSQNPIPSSNPEVEKPADPLKSHATMRVGAGISQIASETFAHLDFRGAYQDLLDNPDGFDPAAQIQSLDGRIRFSVERSHVKLDHLRLIEVISLNPLQKYLSKPSWNVGFGFRSQFSDKCFDCSVAYLEGGPGFTLGNGSNRRLYFTMFGNLFFQAGPWNDTGYQLGPSAVSMLNFDLGSHIRFAIAGNARYSPLGSPDFNYFGSSETAIELNHSFSVRGWYNQYSESHEFGGALLYYF